MTITYMISNALAEIKAFSSYVPAEGVIHQRVSLHDNPGKRDVVKEIFMQLGKEFKESPELAAKFDLESIPEDSVWQILQKLVVTARKQELRQVRIVKRKGKHDIKLLRGTYYGKLMLEDLQDEIGGKWMLNDDEYRKVQVQAKKLGLEFPEEIMPTTTEQFFGEDDE